MNPEALFNQFILDNYQLWIIIALATIEVGILKGVWKIITKRWSAGKPRRISNENAITSFSTNDPPSFLHKAPADTQANKITREEKSNGI